MRYKQAVMAATSCGCGISLQPSTSVGTRQRVHVLNKNEFYVKLSIVVDDDVCMYVFTLRSGDLDVSMLDYDLELSCG